MISDIGEGGGSTVVPFEPSVEQKELTMDLAVTDNLSLRDMSFSLVETWLT